MTIDPDKLDRAMRVGLGILLFVFAAACTEYISLSLGINHWISFSILALGYFVGWLTRGIER